MSSRFSEATLLIVDGRNTLFRSSYANATLGYASPSGWQPTGGVYGFLESVLSVAYRAKNATVVVAWEGRGGKKVRQGIVPEYKVRKPDPKQEELLRNVIRQEAILKRVLSVSGWDSIVSDGWEADDSIGTLAEVGARTGENVLVYSTDADMLQLLEEPSSKERGWVRQVRPTKGMNVLWTAETVELDEDWKVPPELVPDVKALSGDSSDCYKGCPGIGQKWASKIIAEYGGLEEVYDAIETDGVILGSEKKAEVIKANREYIDACLRVAIINRAAPTDYGVGEADRRALENEIATLRFNSLRGEHAMRRMLR